MPRYCYVCPDCGGKKEVVRSMRESSDPVQCDCTTDMVRDFQSERVNIGDKEYARPIVSDALAISPVQAEEHRRIFPDIELEGNCRPVFKSYRQHDSYLKKIGAVKRRQKIRKRGRRIS